MSSVFLSHNSNDKPFVRRLAKCLRDAGVVVWLDEAALNIGDSLIDKISEGIQDMEYVAAVISKNSIASAWVQKELSLAMSREINGRRVVVLPIVIDDCELPKSLRDKLYADFRDPAAFDLSITKLLKAMDITDSNASSVPAAVRPSKSKNNSSDDFTEIYIVGIDKGRTHNPDKRKAMFNVYLELSSCPPNGWGQFFDQERSFPRHTMWRRAYLEGRYIIVHCPIDEIGKHHLADLKKDVANANRNYRDVHTEHLQKIASEQERHRIEEQKRDKELDSLDFS